MCGQIIDSVQLIHSPCYCTSLASRRRCWNGWPLRMCSTSWLKVASEVNQAHDASRLSFLSWKAFLNLGSMLCHHLRPLRIYGVRVRVDLCERARDAYEHRETVPLHLSACPSVAIYDYELICRLRAPSSHRGLIRIAYCQALAHAERNSLISTT